jgi:uncharacterized membrane protein YdbT with pleckstrin-like domain
MEEEISKIIKPSYINALIPLLAKNLFYVLLYILPIYGILVLLSFLDAINWSLNFISIMYILISFCISILIESWTIIKLVRSTYIFEKSHIIIQEKIFSIKTHTVPYSHIVNTTTEISLWDRLSNAGDLILHTAKNSEEGDVKLLFIKNPLEVEKEIHDIILSHKKHSN